MFGFKKDKPKKPSQSEASSQDMPADDSEDKRSENTQDTNRNGLFARLKSGLSRTRHGFTDGLADLVLGKKTIDDDVLDEIETLLLTSDVGVEATQEIVTDLTDRINRKQLADADALFTALHDDMAGILAPVSTPLEIDTSYQPYVILMVGMNGAGKTTTIGKPIKNISVCSS